MTYLRLLILMVSLSCLPGISGAKRCFDVMTTDGNPVQGATLLVTDSVGNAAGAPVVTDKHGHACIDGEYTPESCLVCRRNGFEEYAEILAACPDTIVLTPEATELDQVIVLATKDVVRQRAGTLEFTPGSLKTEVTNIYDLIGYSPMIEPTEGGFKIIGKPELATIWINGRPPREFAGGLAAALKASKAINIKKVEIITNPGGVLGATSSGGIINLILDNPYEGLTGMLGASLSYKDVISHSESLWMTYAKGRWRTTVNAGYSDQRSKFSRYEESEYPNLEKEFKAENTTKSHSESLSASGCVTYAAGHNTLIGVGFSLSDYWNRETSASIGTLTLNGLTTPVNDRIRSYRDWTRPNYSLSAWLEKDVIPEKSNLELAIGYFSSVDPVVSEYHFGDDDRYQDLSNPASGVNASGKYYHVLAARHALTAGFEFNHHNMLYSERYTGKDENRFRYRQTIEGFYAQWQAVWTPAFSTMAGVRGEFTQTRSRQSQDGSDRHDNYFEVSPFISIAYQFTKGQQSLNLDIARKFSRPWYLMLNPYKDWDSQNSYYTGNPDLRRPHRWEFGLTYNFLGCGVLSVNYYDGSDTFWNYTYGDDGYTVSGTTNLDVRRSLTVSAQYYRSFWKRWRVNLTADYNHAYSRGIISGDELSAVTDIFGLSFRSNLVLSYRYDWRLQMKYSMHSPDVSLTNRGSWRNNFGIGITKEFPWGMTLNLYGSDLFFKPRALRFSNSDYRSYSRVTSNIWRIGFSVTYKFGKTTIRDVKSKDKGIMPRLD